MRTEKSASRAGRQEPLRRERARGPQHEVNPAASSDPPRGSRAAHVTAKATSAAQRTGAESAVGPSGVEGAAREQGLERKRRDPSARPWSRQGGPYKPKVKSGAVQRESEGTVVLTMVATNNAAGGKGPWGGHVGGGGKRESMAGKSGPKSSRGPEPADKVQQLRCRLCVTAKRSPGCRFHALLDRTHRSDVLWAAWNWALGGRVMPSRERQPVSRVREIRTHGLIGGLAEISAANRQRGK